MSKSKIGTRSSRLAIAQTQIVLDALRRKNRLFSCEVVTISTRGDIDKRPLFTIDEKGIFEKEINESVIRGEIDFAVHSLKDIPSDLSNDLVVACIPKRARPNDVLVNKKKLKLRELPSRTVVGTSSLRRAIQIIRKRPDLEVKPIRGNVETRVKKAITGEYDAVIVAEAGLTRLGMDDVIAERFDIKDFIPAPGQGAIGIVCRKDNQKLIKMLKSIEDKQSACEIATEGAMLRRVEAGCRFPVGAVAITNSNKKKITLYASIFSADGTRSIELKQTGGTKEPAKLGMEVGDLFFKKGATKLAKGWRDAVEEWNKKYDAR